MGNYQKALCIIMVFVVFGLPYLLLREYHDRYIRRSRRIKRMHDHIFEDLFNEDTRWCDDYGNRNAKRYGRVAEVLGIIAPNSAFTDYFRGIARQLKLETSVQPMLSLGLCMKMCEYLGIKVSPDFMETGTPSQDLKEWGLIAEQLGVKHFEKSYGKKLPVPFIMYAFCELFPYLKEEK